MSSQKRILWCVASILAAVCMVNLLFWRIRTETGDRERAEAFLAGTPLGPLPSGASNVLFHKWSGPFTGETYIRFEVSPGDMSTFIRERAEIASRKPKETYTKDSPLLPWPEDETKLVAPNHYFVSRPTAPGWSAPTILGKGRMYFLWPNAWLHLDEENGIVWLMVVKG